jgi:hypothetical protein
MAAAIRRYKVPSPVVENIVITLARIDNLRR